MTRTGFYSSKKWLTDPRFAHLYGPPVPGGQRQDVTDENGHAPNTGGAFSTATDLLRFAGAWVTAH